MTASAQQFITPLTFQALTGQPVHTEIFDLAQEHAMSHIHLARWADELVIAPASANMLAKMAHGLADDLLSTLYLASECKVSVAPAMNQAMWHKPATQNNIATLIQQGVVVIGPAKGEQACGEQGFGRMSEPADIVNALVLNNEDKKLQNVRILISAGPTREPLDPVRYITNRSSGKMGYAIANAAQRAGADVTLVTGPVTIPAPSNVKLIKVETALDMFAAVCQEATLCDIYIGAAAVADFRPLQSQDHKIKKQHQSHSIDLIQNPDIIAHVAGMPQKPFVVGFAAETDDLDNYAQNKLRSKNLDMIAANWVGKDEGGFDSEQNALQVYWRDGSQHLSMTDKPQLAKQLLQLINEKFHEKNSAQNS